MIELIPHLWVGNGNDLLHVDDGDGGVKQDWFVISAAKEPWHRQALGYKERAAPKDHPEYLMATRPRRLILNLVDVPDPKFFRAEVFNTAAQAIYLTLNSVSEQDGVNALTKVLVHCNEGRSRAPGIALWYLHQETSILPDEHDDAIEKFTKLYPDYAPSAGIAGFIKENW